MQSLLAPASGGFSDLKVAVETLEIVQTTQSSILLEAKLNLTNPTKYSANIPYINLRVAHNGTNVAHVTARNLSISPGFNSDIEISALWDPLQLGGKDGIAAGQDLISRYVSGWVPKFSIQLGDYSNWFLGFNTSVTLRPHKDTFPTLPKLGLALSTLELDIPVPKLRAPGDDDQNPGDDGQSHFIKDATVLSALADSLSKQPRTT